jgi:uncharacterized protein YggL (DUF469 family)
MSAPCPTFGFIVRVKFRDGSTKADALTESLGELLDANGLEMSYGATAFDYAIVREGAQATHADRELILGWATRWSAVADVDVSDLVDLQET